MTNSSVCNQPPPNGGDVPFIPLFAALTAWPLVKMIFESVVARVAPTFYADLKMDIRKKYEVYFGTWLGMVFKPISLVACTAALLATPASTDIVGLVRPLNVAEQWCWGCRAIIYLQEMPHYAAVTELMIHHILSIFAILVVLWYNVPRRQLYLIWAGLLSELFNNARRLLKMHGKLTPRVSWWISFCMAWSIMLLRVTGCFVALLWTMQGGAEGIVLLLNASCLLFYLLYMIKLSIFEFGRTEMLVVDLKRPAKIIVAETYHISLFSVATGLGLLCTEFSALFMYESDKGRTSSEHELRSMSWAALQSVVVGLAGAWMTAPILCRSRNHGGAQNPKPKLCLQGGLIFACLTLLFSPTMAESVNKTTLLACMALSLPLLEMFSQVGAYYAGSELEQQDRGRSSSAESVASIRMPLEKYSDSEEKSELKHMKSKNSGEERVQVQHQQDGVENTTKAEKKPGENSAEKRRSSPSVLKTTAPMLDPQLISSLLNGVLYCDVVLARWVLGVQLHEAAAISIMVQGLIWLNIESLRQKAPSKRFTFLGAPVSLPTLLTLGQIALATGWLTRHAQNSTLLVYSTVLDNIYSLYISLAAVYCALRLITNGLSRPVRHSGPPRTAERRHRGGLITPRNVGLASAVVMLSTIAIGTWLGYAPEEFGSVDGAISRAKRSNEVLWQFASSWQFAVSTLGIAVVPVAVIQALG